MGIGTAVAYDGCLRYSGITMSERRTANRRSRQYPSLPRGVMLCVQLAGIAGFTVLFSSVTNWESPDLLKFGAFLTIAIFSSGVAIDVPSVSGTFSLIFLFVLFGTLELTKPETVLLSALMALAHCYGTGRHAAPR